MPQGRMPDQLLDSFLELHDSRLWTCWRMRKADRGMCVRKFWAYCQKLHQHRKAAFTAARIRCICSDCGVFHWGLRAMLALLLDWCGHYSTVIIAHLYKTYCDKWTASDGGDMWPRYSRWQALRDNRIVVFYTCEHLSYPYLSGTSLTKPWKV